MYGNFFHFRLKKCILKLATASNIRIDYFHYEKKKVLAGPGFQFTSLVTAVN